MVLLYATSLEVSTDPSVRFRASGAYQALHKLCVNAKPPLANAAQFRNYKDWCDEPKTWIVLGEALSSEGDATYLHIVVLRFPHFSLVVYSPLGVIRIRLSSGEPLLAKNGYDLFVKKIDDLTSRGKPVAGITAGMWVKVAENCCSFQNFEKAVDYGEVNLGHFVVLLMCLNCSFSRCFSFQMALTVDRLYKPARDFLSKVSPIHSKLFLQEKKAIGTISSQWLERMFTAGSRRKVNISSTRICARLGSNRCFAVKIGQKCNDAGA